MSLVVKAVVHVQRQQHLTLMRLMCSQIKDLARAPPDLLLQNLKSCPSIHNVLEAVSTHHKIMNSKHSMQALRSIFEIQKNEKTDVSMHDILKHASFVRLCKKLKSQAGLIELNETIEALKVMSFLGVPSDSIISQTLLQLIRHNVNLLSLNHIMFLDFLLSQFKRLPLVEALKIALPIVFEVNLPIKMDRENLYHLTEYLFYASKVPLSRETNKLIVKSLLNYQGEFDAKSAKSIIWSICELDSDVMYQPLLEKAIGDFVVHMDDVSFSDMEITVSRLMLKYSSKFQFYYSEVLLDSVANNVIDHDLGFGNAVYVLKKFIRVNHWNKYLLDYICKKVEEDNSLVQDDSINIYTLTVSVALTDYRPPNWHIIEDLIRNNRNLIAGGKKELIWLRFAASLCLLNIYKLDVLTKCFREDYLQTVLKGPRVFMSDVEHFLAIWYSIHMNKPEYVDLLPIKYDPETLIDYLRPIEEFPLEGALIKGVGGEQFVATNLVSKHGQQIDHAILFRQGGFPVAFNDNQLKFIEDIQVPEDHQLVCILLMKPVMYTINTKMLKETAKISHKYLEEKNQMHIVPISLEVWERIPDHEKIPYLMQNIKEKIQCDVKESLMI